MSKPPKRKIVTTAVTESGFNGPQTDSVPLAEENTQFEHIFKKPTDPLSATPSISDSQANLPVLPQGAPVRVTLSEDFQNQCGISTIEAKNYTQGNVSSCRLFAYKRNGKQQAWSVIVLTKITNIVANQYWVVINSQTGNFFFCYEIQRGSLHLSLHFDSPVSRIVLSDNFCAIQNKSKTKEEQITVWDFRQTRSPETYKIPSLVAKNFDRLASVGLSCTGLPIITMKSGEIMFYSRKYREWRQAQSGIDMLASILSHLEFIQKVVPNGLISKIVINRKNLKIPTLTSSYTAEDTEDEQIEMLLSALDELDYPEEYMLLSSVYVSRLVARGNIRRLYSYLQVLNCPPVDSRVDFKLVREEVSKLLEHYPNINRELGEFSNQTDDDFVEDLGFLTS